MFKTLPISMVGLATLLYSTSVFAQNACPAQVSFNSESSAIDGSFQAVEVGDLNGDNNVDALWLDSANAQILVDFGDGAGDFSSSQTFDINHADSVAVGDLNGDQVPDLVAFDPTADRVVIYPGEATGGFANLMPLEVSNGNLERDFTLYDFDSDNQLDIISTQVNGPDCVVVRLAADGFAAPTGCLIDISSGRLHPFDLDGDNKDEFAQSGSAIIYSRVGNNFSVLRDLSAELNLNTIGEVKPRDVDGDGDVDIQVSGTDAGGAVLINFDNRRITECNDNADNDGDGDIDLNDFGCSSGADPSEGNPNVATACADGIDNDNDGDIDTADSACVIPGNNTEESGSCGAEDNVATVVAGNFTMSTVGESNDLGAACAVGLQPNAADQVVAFQVNARSSVNIDADGQTANFEPYIFVMAGAGCADGSTLACDNTVVGGSTSLSFEDLAPGTYFLGLGTNTAFGVDEGEASITLTITPINPLDISAPGELCDDSATPANPVFAFADFNGDGQDDTLSLANGERVVSLQEVCGNGVARGGEECDDGNQLDNDECLSSCVLNVCGDGHLNADAEECDDGNNVDDDGCNNNCKLPACGNGVTEFGEECDDGNDVDGDACTNACTDAICGDLVTRTDLNPGDVGYESCDDGNEVDGDGCFQCEVSTQFSFVSFNGGTYTIGEMSTKSNTAPDTSIQLGVFVMSRSEVTVAQYNLCVQDFLDGNPLACRPPITSSTCNYGKTGRESHPMNCVNSQEAETYVQWLDTQIPDIDLRLPSEAEWEFAARSLGEQRRVSWIETGAEPCDVANLSACEHSGTTPVCSYSGTFASPDLAKPNGDTAQGLCDMSGNVEEWVADYYTRSYSGIPTDGAPNVSGTSFYRIFRGGSFLTSPSVVNTSSRFPTFKTLRRPNVGIRVGGSPRCGNREVDPAFGETCDDGNQQDGDGCSATCQRECGNGILDVNAPDYVEECDDNNFVSDDGCSETCEIEAGYECDNTNMPSNCFRDTDLDGVIDANDNCVNIPNDQQEDADNDGVGDVCDNCVNISNNTQDDIDNDTVGDACDNCVNTSNLDQTNSDTDNFGDACDNCINDDNNDQLDDDNDQLGDACDSCPGDDNTNSDGDTLCDALDNCDSDDNEGQEDGDNDGIGDACDTCVEDPKNDEDGDGVCVTSDPNTTDNCPTVANGDQLDDDNDGVGDACDVCAANTGHDNDFDGICSAAVPDPDNCPDVANDGQEDLDGDDIGDVCDDDRDGDGDSNDDEVACNRDPDLATDSIVDADADNICDNNDLCQGDNATLDVDNDGDCGDVDLDDDEDGWPDLDEVACGTLPDNPASTPVDDDNDGVCNANDICDGDDATGDTDNDDLCNDLDTDDDGDNVNSTADGGDDCDDLDPAVGSVALDQDCDGITDDVDTDRDGDGVDAVAHSGDDCDDTDDTLGSRALNFDCDAQVNDDDDDDDNDGVTDANDPDDDNPAVCGDADNDTCDDCSAADPTDYSAGDNFTEHANFNVNGNYINDGPDADGDGLCDAGDNDSDNDGFADDIEDDCNTSPNDINDFPIDTDGDDLCDDVVDTDNDNDGVLNGDDPDDTDPSNCGDIDNDGCGDCALTAADDFAPGANFILNNDGRVTNDGDDTDGDGLCNVTDNDNDNDGFDDGYEVSCNKLPNDPTSFPVDTDGDNECNHLDADDDGDTFSDIKEQGCGTDSLDNTDTPVDTDNDGLCDKNNLGVGEDDDNDNDGVNNDQDDAPLDPNACRDADNDTCDDCVSGTDAPNADGPDLDLDGLCDAGDDDRDGDEWTNQEETDCGDGDPDDFAVKPSDADNDGTCDAQDNDADGDFVSDDVDTNSNNEFECADQDGDGCDDCAIFGFPSPGDDGPDNDDDGACDSFDTDDDNDGFSDADEETCLNLAATLDAAVTPDDYDGDNECDDGVDGDDDNDGVADGADACSKGVLGWISDTSSTDHDGDGCKDDNPGDEEDDDDDNDGVADADDLCPKGNLNWTSDQATNDFDGDGCEDGTAEETDKDNDGVDDNVDRCPEGETGWTSDQATTDHDQDGCRDDTEDDDDDDDGVTDANDLCDPESGDSDSAIGWGSDPATTDHDQDGCQDDDGDADVGAADADEEDQDDDNDGLTDDLDACDPDSQGTNTSEIGWDRNNLTDRDQDGCRDAGEDTDDDNDGLSDADEIALGTSTINPDSDFDQTNDFADNCPLTSNFLQDDRNSNDIGDVCDDPDNDGVFDSVDNCPDTFNDTQDDHNNDDEGDACETDDPVAVNDTYSTDEDVNVSGDVLDNDTDADDAKADLTVTLVDDVDVTEGTLTLNGDGTFDFDPADNFNGDAVFTYTVNDGRIDSAQATVTITVNSVNDAPVAVADAFAIDEDTLFDSVGAGLNLTANDTDTENDTLTVILVDDVTEGTLTFTGNDFTYQADPHYHGADSFTYKLSDGDLESNTVTVTITVNSINDAPVATFDTAQTATEDGAPVTGQLTSTDNDTGDTATYTIDGAAIAGFNLAGDGSWSFDPSNLAYQSIAENATTDITVNYIVTDAAGDTGNSSFVITVTGVNDDPTATFNAAQAATEDGATISDTLTATDVDDGAVLTFALAAPIPDGLTLTGAGWDFDPNHVAYQDLKQNETRDVTVSYTVTDVEGGVGNGSFTITVTGVNDAPTATFDAQQDVNEDGVVINLQLTADDNDAGDSEAYALTNGPISGLAVNADGSVTFDPSDADYQDIALNLTETVTVQYSVTDGAGGVGNGSFDIVITGANDSPVATFSDAQAATEDGAAVNGNLTGTDVDAGDTLTFSLDAAVDGLTLTNAAWSFDPVDTAYQDLAAGETRDVVVNYTVTDNNSATGTGSFTITVTGVNDAPTATFTAQQDVNEDDAQLNVQLTVDDADTSNTHTFSLDNGPIAGLLFNGNGSVIFAPSNAAYQDLDAGDTLTVTVNYTVTDSSGDSASNTFDIVVTGVNDDPVATYTTAQAINEDDVAGLTDTLTATDVDADDVLNFSLDAPVAGLSLSGANNETWTFNATDAAYQDLDAGDTVNVTVNYTVTDSQGATDSESFVITVTGVNDAPSATFTTQQDVNEDDASISDTLTFTDSDADDTITFAHDNPPIAGFTLDGATGVWTFDPSDNAYQALAQGETQTLTVDYTVTDSGAATSSNSFDIIVTGVNDAPDATFDADQVAIEDDVDPTGQLTATDVDNGAALSFSLVAPTPSGVTLAGDIWTFDTSDPAYQDLDANDVVELNVAYEVSDGLGGTDQNSFKITVTGANDAPDATFTAGQTATEDGAVVNGTLTFTDVDADDTAVFSHDNAPIAGFALNVNTGAWSFDPSDAAYQHIKAGATETVTVNYTVTDSQGGDDSASFDIVVTGVNDAPDATFTAALAINEDDIAGLTDTLTSTDVDDDATAAFALVNPPAGVSLTGADWSFDALDNAYQDLAVGETREVTVTYSVTDDENVSDTNTFTITVTGVNDDPSATFTDAVTLTEDSATRNGNVTGTDVDTSDTLSFTHDNGPVTGFSFTDATGAWALDPSDAVYQALPAGGSTTLNIDYSVLDGQGGSASETFTITVNGVNDAPTATFTAAQTATEDGAEITGDLTGDDIDTGDVLTFALLAPIDGVSLAGTTWTFDPTHAAYQDLKEGETRDVVVNYSVTDTSSAFDTESFTITVTGVNDLPSATFTTAQAVNEDDALLEGAVTADDADDQDPLTFSLDSGPAGFTLDANGDWDFDPSDAAYQDLDAGDQLALTVDYTVTDGENATDSASFTITVTGVNDAPVATYVEANNPVTEDGAPLVVALTATDVDADDTLTFDLDAVTAGLTLAGDTWTFDPTDNAYQPLDDGETDSLTISYTVTDSQGATDTETFGIQVAGVNDAPVAVDDNGFTVDEDQVLTVNAAGGLLGNDSDIDDEPFTASVVADPTNGAVVLAGDGSFVYTPTGDFAGADSFTYRVNDGDADSNIATVSITVNNVPDAPVLGGATPADAAQLDVVEGNLLAISIEATDADAGDTLLYTMNSDLPGTAVLNANTGAFNWTPTWDEAGSYNVTFKVTDSTGLTDEVSVTIVATFLDNDNDTLPDSWEALEGLDNTSVDSDNDGISDLFEVGDFASLVNTDGDPQVDAPDTDNDGTPDAADTDSDGDTVSDADEAGDADLATDPVNTDSDNTPDFRDTDSDGDLIDDDTDNCRITQNNGQENLDNDAEGDACDDDRDNDNVDNDNDNCPDVANGDQTNTDEVLFDGGNTDVTKDDAGDACDDDDDGDGLLDTEEDFNNDNILDAGELFLTDPLVADSDLDGKIDGADNCPEVNNPGQEDNDAVDNQDEQGDAYDPDDDNDGLLDTEEDSVNPGVLDAGELALTDPFDADTDDDGFQDDIDLCPVVADLGTDTDFDNIGDACDDDLDNDGVPNTVEDPDNSGTFTAGDPSDLTKFNSDFDSKNDGEDNCPLVTNENQRNTDQDLFDAGNADVVADARGDACDDDDDGDGIEDIKEDFNNSGTLEGDEEFLTDPLDPDTDEDGDLDGADNCPLIANADQTDTNNNNIGDVCDNDADSDTFSNSDEQTCGSLIDDATSVPTDTDGDGECDDGIDDDDDNDGIADVADSCSTGFIDLGAGQPWVSDNATDYDGDGCRDEDQDTDDDNDTFSDTLEGDCGSLPKDEASLPTDLAFDQNQDGECDNLDDDIDGDGVLNGADAFPTDPAESVDTDNDQIGNNADPDDDGDGFTDAIENDCGSLSLDVNDVPDDADNDGLCDSSDPCYGDNNNAGIDDTRDLSPADGQPDFPDGTITVGGVLFDLCTDLDLDDDNDGYSDADEIICGSNPNPGLGSAPTDIDNDDLCDTGANFGVDQDDDNDGVSDADEDAAGTDPNDPSECGDSDGDNCDDCSGTAANNFAAGDNFTTADFNGVTRVTNDGPDEDNDGLCDAGDNDSDNDGFSDGLETDCGSSINDDQDTPVSPARDSDGDGTCDNLDGDRDGDNVNNGDDAFPDDGTESADTDNDGTGDNADLDLDGDGVTDDTDQCDDPSDPNHQVSWNDGDNDNDGCRDNSLEDQDDDNDGDLDGADNCPLVSNAGQENHDNDAFGDACDDDKDNDGVDANDDDDDFDNSVCKDDDNDGCDDCSVQNSPNTANDGTDTDSDGICDAFSDDDDGDGFTDAEEDECGSDPLNANSKPTDLAFDPDGDGVCGIEAGDKDNCPNIPNAGQENTAGGPAGDACECGDGIVSAANGEQCDDGGDSATCDSDCTPVECGDNHVNAAANEQCDDGNNDNTDACVNVAGVCVNATCGDNHIEAGEEECDDGNNNNDDGCTNSCTSAICGDGFQQGAEECDDGNNSNNDACTNECKDAVCGDGFEQPGEECDDGDNDNTDECVNIGGACLDATCGDGQVQAGVEECDDGDLDNSDACLDAAGACTIALCGDGETQVGVEECDDGNNDNTDVCVNIGGQCFTATCGDGLVFAGQEDCDDEGESADCNDDCTAASCGDGVVNTTAGEQCDDGNNNNDDACRNDCTTPVCGNGQTEPGEQCDDGVNNSDVVADACRTDCQDPTCGDGIIDPSNNEECDDGNNVNDDACSNTCKASACGDGIKQANEECDDGDDNSDTDPDACRESCLLPTCGDGIRDLLLGEDCDDGNDSDADGCLNNCSAAECGDGIVRLDLDGNGDRIEECDDANNQDGDACSPPGAGDGGCKTTTAIGWREISGGSFRFNDLTNQNASFPLVNISTFEMTRSEITVAQYAMCVTAGACTAPRSTAGCSWGLPDNETLPVNCIRHLDAVDFADWMNQQDNGHVVSLPSESEWEYAARSEGKAHLLPADLDSVTCDNFTARSTVCGLSNISPVCSRSRERVDLENTSDTEQGLCDMVGSADEFVADSYTSSISNVPTDGTPFTLTRTFYYITRGGAWNTTKTSVLTTTNRVPQFYSKATNLIGFRLVRRDIP